MEKYTKFFRKSPEGIDSSSIDMWLRFFILVTLICQVSKIDD